MFIKFLLTKLASVHYVTPSEHFKKVKLNCDSIAFAIHLVFTSAAFVCSRSKSAMSD